MRLRGPAASSATVVYRVKLATVFFISSAIRASWLAEDADSSAPCDMSCTTVVIWVMLLEISAEVADCSSAGPC